MSIRTFFLLLVLAGAAWAAEGAAKFEYRLLATSKTSTMEKEMNEAAARGFVYSSAMGGESAFGGNEVVVVMARDTSSPGRRKYRLLATGKTSTMQKEMQATAAEGYTYCGQTVFESKFGGREVAVLMERDEASDALRHEYLLLATAKTSTMQKELEQAGAEGFRLLGLTVAKTAFGGSEVVSILGRAAAK
ncbi:MAG TPA: hypothetical protein VN428_04250 [Bryobacteraceae bacterium]|nr:hypothetical protein [Bryobacteraceae bacterium]